MIKLNLHVTDIQPPGEKDGKDYPVVSFKGISWSLHNSWDPNANSEIRGQKHYLAKVCSMYADYIVNRRSATDT